MQKFIIFIVLLAVSVHQGQAKLKCYQCMSSSPRDSCHNPRSAGLKAEKCSDDAVSKFVDLIKTVVSSEPLQQVCMKTNIRDGSELVTKRECVMVKTNELVTTEKCSNLLTQLGERGKIEYCGICYRDGCNPASNLVPTLTLIPILSVSFLVSTILARSLV